MTVDALIDRYLAAQGVRLTDDTATGRRAVATRRFARGSVILSLPPLHLLPARDGEPDADDRAAELPPTRCTHCLDALGARRARCSQCHVTQYCSSACLAQNWSQRHHLLCGGPVARADALKPAFRATLRMLVGVQRMLTCIARAQGGQGAVRPAEWMLVQAAAWRHLQAHRPEHPPYVVKQYEEIAGVARLNGVDAVDMLCRFGCNNFAAYDWRTGVQAAGQVCSPLASLAFNHSCRPTALALYDAAAGGCHVVRALTDIRPGDELTVAYVDALYPRTQRIERLRAVYYFDCQCGRCAGDGPNACVDRLLDRGVPEDALPAGLPVDLADTPRGPEPWAVAVVDALLDLVLAEDGRRDELAFERLVAGCIAGTQPRDVSFAAYRHWLECQDDCLDRVAAGAGGGAPHVVRWAGVAARYVLAFYALAYRPFHPLVARQCLRLAQTVQAAVV
ncbi:hypothetical protein GGI15_002815, partial [Coemansia interrupta]